jgi:hypothetical protein
MSNSSGRVQNVQIRLPEESPPVVGFADRSFLVKRGREYEIAFLDSVAGIYIARLIVSEGPLIDHLWGTASQFFEETRKSMKGIGVDPTPPLTGLDKGSLPIAQPANAFRMFRLGLEAGFEAYYVQPRVIFEAREKTRDRAKTVQARAICHVALSLQSLIGLLEAVEQVATNSDVLRI